MHQPSSVELELELGLSLAIKFIDKLEQSCAKLGSSFESFVSNIYTLTGGWVAGWLAGWLAGLLQTVII